MSTEDSTPGTTDGTGTTGSTTGARSTTGTTAADAPRARRPGVRVGTAVWGLVLALVGVGVLLVAAGYTIDLQLAAIVLLIAAGVGLILGPLVQGVRRSRAGAHDPHA